MTSGFRRNRLVFIYDVFQEDTQEWLTSHDCSSPLPSWPSLPPTSSRRRQGGRETEPGRSLLLPIYGGCLAY